MVQNRWEEAREPVSDRQAAFAAAAWTELEVERVLNLLSTVERVLDDSVSYSKVSDRTPATLDGAMGAAQHALAHGWSRWTSGHRDTDTARIAAVLLQLGVLRSSVRNTASAQRDHRVFGISAFLHNIRACSTVAELLDRVPAEVNRLGLGRVLVSRVEEGRWTARTAAVIDAPDLAHDMIRVGNEHPGTLTGAMVETEMVRRRTPILVHEAKDNPRVHPQLRSLIDCHAYVSAPVMVSGKVVSLVHADQNVETGTVDEADRDVIGAVAEGLGFAIERTLFQERLRGLRRQLDQHHRSVNELIDSFVDGDAEMSPRFDELAPVPAAEEPVQDVLHPEPRTDQNASGAPSLTRREIEVLRHMALGETNAQIASRLFVSEGTVKTHAKHILRKLGAANRAEAVSRYYQLMRKA
ncbi:LuxR C-terminal-related transcriptional regulator [Amycolatopsis methanolica]|uniref:LuxR C-terminal-related transcriptional regulator n=1 Tax=Amycolatopsis methanolica TaxID=1814 RepID=UPI00341B781F